MKLVVSVVHCDDEAALISALTGAGYGATKISSTGGFLRQGNATILVGVSDEQVAGVLELIKHNCCTRRQLVNPLPPVMEPGEIYLPAPVEVLVGGATVFVLDVCQFEHF